MKKLKNILSGIKNFFSKVHSKLPKIPPMKPETREKLNKVVNFMNRFSIIFHIILACFLTFIIEFISRRNLRSTLTFMDAHTWAYLYNSLIIFVSLSIVYFFRRRALARVIISGLWLFLGIINGCILAKRVSPFSFTDLKMVGDLFTMQSN